MKEKDKTFKKGNGLACHKVMSCSIIFVFFVSAYIMWITDPQGLFLNQIHKHDCSKLEPYREGSEMGWSRDHSPATYKPSGIVDRLLAKKWDSYVFVSFNYYLVEVTLVDLTYASQIIITYSSFKKTEQILSENFASFSLENNFWAGDDIRINNGKLKFNLTRKETETEQITWIEFQTMKGNKTLKGNLTQTMDKSHCMAFNRPYSSLKCLHGKSDGFVKSTFSHYDKNYRISQQFDDLWVFSRQVGTTMYDGFRGSGYDWYWVWAMGIGWTENIQMGFKRKQEVIKNVGVSLGHMYGLDEDFLLVDDQLIKLEGVQYSLDESKKWQLLHFTSSNPKGWFEFNVTARHHYKEDLFAVQKDMHKAYGKWHGEVELPEGKLEFDKLFGIVEISKSHF